jgi:hypothetical protein
MSKKTEFKLDPPLSLDAAKAHLEELYYQRDRLNALAGDPRLKELNQHDLVAFGCYVNSVAAGIDRVSMDLRQSQESAEQARDFMTSHMAKVGSGSSWVDASPDPIPAPMQEAWL